MILHENNARLTIVKATRQQKPAKQKSFIELYARLTPEQKQLINNLTKEFLGGVA